MLAALGGKGADGGGGVCVRSRKEGRLWLSRVAKRFSDDPDHRKHGVKIMKWGNTLLLMSDVKGVLLPKK